MKIKKNIQFSFQNGITENIKQDVSQDAENENINSVLYMENWNPNLEIYSLIRRPGQLPILKSDNSLLTLSIRNYSIVIPNYMSDYADRLDELILHSKILKSSNPVFNDNYVLFIKRIPKGEGEEDFYPDPTSSLLPIPATGIVAHVQQGIMTEPDWKEPFHDDETYKGWYVFGTVQDVERYGESLIFVSSLDKNEVMNIEHITDDYATFIESKKGYLFPVYIWRLWDLKKLNIKKEEFFNGIDFDTSLMQCWKVKTPAISLTNDSFCAYGIKDTVSSTSELYDGIGNTVAGDTLYEKFNEDNTDIELLDGDKNAPIQLLIWEDAMYTADNIPPSDFLPDCSDKINIFELSDSTYDNLIIPSKNGYFKKDKDFNFKGNTSYKHIETIEYPNYNFMEEIGKTGDSLKRRYETNQGKYDVYHGGTCHRLEQDLDVTRIYQYCLRWVFNNYVENKMPRPWLRDERIPILVTIVIDGIELVLSKFIYKVKSTTEVINPVHYNVSGKNDHDELGIFAYSQLPLINDCILFPSDQMAVGSTSLPTYSSGITDSKWKIVNVLVPIQVGDGNAQHIQYQSRFTHGGIRDLYGSPGTVDLQYREMGIFFTIRIKGEFFESFMENNIGSINVYVSKANLEDNMMKSLGMLSKNDPITGLYSPPMITDEQQLGEYDNYGLIKKFIIKGKGYPIKEALTPLGEYGPDWENYNGETLNTNSWYDNRGMSDEADNFIYAVPQNSDKTPNSMLPDIYSGSNKNMTFSPDFMIWDYAVDKDSLVLGASGEYWDGIGANILAIIKSRVFIGNTIDKNGDIEQGIIRYSAVQKGVISQDIFNKEDFMNVGHLPYTALIEYREELIIFDINNFYRLQLNEIANPTTWEFVDTVTGTGTFSKKTICVTPYGFVYGNYSDIWLSDGSFPKSLSSNPEKGIYINSLYQLLMTGSSYVYTSLIDPGKPCINNGYNKYSEFIYDIANDELVVVFPVKRSTGIYDAPTKWHELTHELRLIYNFKNNNWRVESYLLHSNSPVAAYYLNTVSKIGRMYNSNPDIISTKAYYGWTDITLGSKVEFGKSDIRTLDDIESLITDTLLPETILITHEYGNGKDDYLLQKFILEFQARNEYELLYGDTNFIFVGYEDLSYLVTKDPILEFELRNRGWKDDTSHLYLENYNNIDEVNISQSDTDGWYDLVERNMSSKIGINKANVNPYKTLLESPGGTIQPIGSNWYPKESMILLTPINTKFRRTRFRLKALYIAKLRSFNLQIVKFDRRSI